MIVPLLITIGAILTSLVAWYQWSLENEEKIENELLNKENKDLLLKINSLSIEAASNSEKSKSELVEVNSKLYEAQKTVDKFKTDALNNLTGGDGYLFFTFVKVDITEGMGGMNLFIRNDFNNPIYNSTIQIFDYNKLKSSSYKKEGLTDVFMNKPDWNAARLFDLKIAEVPPLSNRISEELFQPSEISLIIYVNSRNRTTIGKIAMVKENDHFYAGMCVTDNSGNILKEEILETTPAHVKKKISERLKEIKYIEYKFSS